MYTLDFTVTLHQLRHTYITNLIYSGIDPKTVQYLAGHGNKRWTVLGLQAWSVDDIIITILYFYRKGFRRKLDSSLGRGIL